MNWRPLKTLSLEVIDSNWFSLVPFWLNTTLWPFPEVTHFLCSHSSLFSLLFSHIFCFAVFSPKLLLSYPRCLLLSLNRLDLCVHNELRGEWAGLIQPTARKGFDDVICMNEPVSGLFPLRWKWSEVKCWKGNVVHVFLLNQTGGRDEERKSMEKDCRAGRSRRWKQKVNKRGWNWLMDRPGQRHTQKRTFQWKKI